MSGIYKSAGAAQRVETHAAVRSLPPLLAIVGGRDVMLDSAETRDRLERFAPRAKVLFLPDAYHVIPGHTDVIHDFLRAPQPV